MPKLLQVDHEAVVRRNQMNTKSKMILCGKTISLLTDGRLALYLRSSSIYTDVWIDHRL